MFYAVPSAVLQSLAFVSCGFWQTAKLDFRIAPEDSACSYKSCQSKFDINEKLVANRLTRSFQT